MMEHHGVKWTLDAYVTHNEAMRLAEAKLHEEREKRYDLLDKTNKAAATAAFAAAQKADEKAESVFLEYKKGANEWRDTIKDLIAVMQGGSKGMRDMWGWIVSAALAGAMLFNTFGPHAK